MTMNKYQKSILVPKIKINFEAIPQNGSPRIVGEKKELRVSKSPLGYAECTQKVNANDCGFWLRCIQFP